MRQFAKFAKTTLPGLFPQWHPSVLPHSEKIRKKHHHYTSVCQIFAPKIFTVFKKNWKIFISAPTISPTLSDLCANLSLKRLQKKCRAVPLILPPSHRTCIMHTVHMRKIWKCSPFFWKIFNFFQLHENRACLSSSGIFPNFWKSVPLFCVFLRKIYRYTNHITDLELFLDILSSKAIRRKVACIPPLPRLFPKHPPVALLLLEKIQKNLLHTTDCQDYPPVL